MLKSTATALLIALSAACFAHADRGVRTEEIRFDAQDLSDAQRLNALRAEIRDAAQRVCDAGFRRNTLERHLERNCVENAVDDALRQLETRLDDKDRIIVAQTTR